MTEEAAAPEPEAKKSGTLKIVLIIVIVLLLAGVGAGFYVMMPEKVPVLKPYLWPPEDEKPIEVSATLSDGSSVLLTNVRLETVPSDLDKLQAKIQNEFAAKKSVIESILTEVANSMTAENAMKPDDFKRISLRRINDELTQTEVERILIKDWIVHPSE